MVLMRFNGRQADRQAVIGKYLCRQYFDDKQDSLKNETVGKK
jgi:hypothetical protein